MSTVIRNRLNLLERTFPWLMPAGAWLSILCLGCVFAVLLGGILASVRETGWPGLWAAFSLVWKPGQGQFGILPMLPGSVALAGAATALALPLCLGLLGFVWG